MSWLSKGYVTLKVNGRQRPEHVLIAERALGKPLPAGAVVHHHDENRSNNANNNLVICEDNSYHLLLHRRARVVRAGGDPDTDAVCGTCEKAKPLADFHMRRRVQKSGVVMRPQDQCRTCLSEYWRQREKRLQAERREARAREGFSHLLGTTQAAAVLHVTRETVRNWVDSGFLVATRDSRGVRRIDPKDLVPLMGVRYQRNKAKVRAAA